MNRTEIITRADGPVTAELAPGVTVRVMATGSMGAVGVTTSLATFAASAELPYHQHSFGEALVLVEGRRYVLHPFDAMHIPAGTPHAVRNPSTDCDAVLHSSFASATPSRETVADTFAIEDCGETTEQTPESLVRFATAPIYELAPQAYFRDLFARRFGSRGLCGGYGVFEPGASLPCHFHAYDESITIVSGEAVCQVAGKEYLLSGCATACIPKGRRHRFLNHSDRPMAMIWVYAGDEPERTIVDACYCQDPASADSQTSEV
jgi:quercetin dioxygenase-like cupin family protein